MNATVATVAFVVAAFAVTHCKAEADASAGGHYVESGLGTFDHPPTHPIVQSATIKVPVTENGNFYNADAYASKSRLKARAAAGCNQYFVCTAAAATAHWYDTLALDDDDALELTSPLHGLLFVYFFPNANGSGHRGTANLSAAVYTHDFSLEKTGFRKKEFGAANVSAKMAVMLRVPVAWFDIVNFPIFDMELRVTAGADGPSESGEVDFFNTAYLPPLVIADEYGMPVPTLANAEIDIVGASGVVYPVTTTQAAPLGDYNLDGIVDAADYVVWRKSVGQSRNLEADGNNSGSIDSQDYEIWRRHYGQIIDYAEGTSILSTVVPEPVSCTMVAIAGLFVASRFRRR